MTIMSNCVDWMTDTVVYCLLCIDRNEKKTLK